MSNVTILPSVSTAILLVAAVMPARAGEEPGKAPPPTHTVAGMRCWHDVPYGPRADLPDEGDGYTGKKPGWTIAEIPWKFNRHRSGQTFDVFAPPDAPAPDATVVLFIHGGSWSESMDKDATPIVIFGPLTASGAIACTANYILQTDPSRGFAARRRNEATFAEMLRDIDAACEKLKSFVAELGVTKPRFVVMGESAGGHLALLYAYDEDNPDHMGLELKHPMSVDKVVNIVGPTDFTEKAFQESGAFSIFGIKFYPFKTLMNRLCGLPDSAPMAKTRAAFPKWSPIKLVCPGSAPTAIAYGAIGGDEKTDGIVPVSQMTSLEAALKAAGVPCAMKKYSGRNHCEITWHGASWIVEQALLPVPPEKMQ